MLNNNAGIEADLSVTCISKNKYRIVTGSGVREHDKKHILKHLKKDLKFKDITDEYACFGIFGPKSRSLLSDLVVNEFENSSGEEILEQRKKKFLNIGKQKSFTVFSENENNLFNKYNLLTFVKRNLLKYKNGLVITILLFLLVVFFLN